LAGWLVGCLVGWLGGWLVGWLVWLAGSLGWLAGCLADEHNRNWLPRTGALEKLDFLEENNFARPKHIILPTQMVAIGPFLGRSWLLLGRSLLLLGHSWLLLSRSWVSLGRSWVALGHTWAGLRCRLQGRMHKKLDFPQELGSQS
jgi:hypothetical protein